MKRIISMVLATVLLLSGCSASAQPAWTEQTTVTPEAVEDVAIFPKTDCFIGDTMPYYEDGTMNVYYLADQRDGKTGYHPWALIRTQDYCAWEDMGVVIPYAESATEQDIALGTGCVIRDQSGGYHAFYTGHNDYYAPKEAIMHAVSADMVHWTKVPEDTFVASEAYSQDDFRDPYVFWVEEEHCWWMLVVTRSNGTGVIARYTSPDLSKWEDQGIFFTDDMGYGTNMECPSLVQFGGLWYLAFSDQWPDRVVHYRVSDSMSGPFRRLDRDTVDGNGFYAGRLEKDAENLYLVGWNGTKFDHDDENDYDWAGNAVIHQLSQQSDGTLLPVPNTHVVEKMSHPMPVSPELLTETVSEAEGGWQFQGQDYELVQFDAFEGSTRVEADVSGFGAEGRFGFAFAPDTEQVGTMNYVLNVKENRVEFFNTDNIIEADPQSSMDFDFTGKESVHLTLLIADGVACLFVDNQVALTARMYRSQGTSWELFGVNTPVQWSNVSIYR